MLGLAREFGVPDFVTAAGANLLRRTMIAVDESVYQILVIGELSPCSVQVLATLDDPVVMRAYATCVRIATKVLGSRSEYPADMLTTWVQRLTGVRYPDSTIRHLELEVLDALEWRLGCVEPLEPGELVTLGTGAPAARPAARQAESHAGAAESRRADDAAGSRRADDAAGSHAGADDADPSKKRLRGVLLSPLFGCVTAGGKRVRVWSRGGEEHAGADGEEAVVRADDGVVGQR